MACPRCHVCVASSASTWHGSSLADSWHPPELGVLSLAGPAGQNRGMAQCHAPAQRESSHSPGLPRALSAPQDASKHGKDDAVVTQAPTCSVTTRPSAFRAAPQKGEQEGQRPGEQGPPSANGALVRPKAHRVTASLPMTVEKVLSAEWVLPAGDSAAATGERTSAPLVAALPGSKLSYCWKFSDFRYMSSSDIG